ncbi:receptor-like protein EIX1 [Euphorbia lathyris]|uniref:receptor-like protein EIX1 n=1 Tax=Euphorbia lathyris TaxID=212925 RepID=UPI003313D8A3
MLKLTLFYYLTTYKSSMNVNFPFQQFISLFLLLFYVHITTFISLCNGELLINCIDTERDALLALKNGLSDPSARLSSWVGDDCCRWKGIQCNNQTGNVVKLDLRNPFRFRSLDVYALSEKEVEDYKSLCLSGELSSSLLHLKHLNYLDLSLNNFEGIQIPEFLGSFQNLRYLNLSYSSFTGQVPPHLGNLSNLQYLDINGYSYNIFGASGLYVENPEWLFGLYSLKYLDMGSIQINSTQGVWLNAINRIPSLLELHLHECELADILVTLPFVNFTSLLVLDLSKNSFNSSIPQWLFNLTSLAKLDLSSNSFSGSIPSGFSNLVSLQDLDLSLNGFIGGELLASSFGNLCTLKNLKLAANKFSGQISEFLRGFSVCSSPKLVSFDLNSNQFSGELPDLFGNLKNLRVLDFAYNSFWGSIPSTIGNLSSLEFLYLHSNKMNGSIPESFGQLSKLVDLNLNANSWEGVMTEVHLMNLSSLETIMLSNDPTKSLILNVNHDWIPPFKLKYIQLENCRVGPSFPMYLQVQNELTQVTLVNAGIADTIPEGWFSKLSSHLVTLDLSDNYIKGKLPLKLEFPKLQIIDLSSNEFEGPLPLWSTNVTQFYLHYNKFSGSIPENIGELMPRLQNLHLSDNLLNGTIPSTICKMIDLQVLALRNNKLHGELIACWENMQSLWVVDASNNSLSGRIPASLGYVRSLGMLLLSNNSLDGEIPSALQNCSVLSSIDLGGNRLSGDFPSWIGVNVSSVFMLRLRSNMLGGHIPRQICSLRYLHFLDLSHNNFSGMIPSCMDNLTSLVYGNSSEQYYHNFQYRLAYFKEQTMVVTKGREYEFNRNIALMNAIDLSENNLEGKIPDEMTSLKALVLLNLSRNHISGSIPAEIGNLNMLETFDLSHNNFSGTVPESLSSLTFLSHLDLSYNNLSGKIPTGNQLQSLNASSIYEGNPFVCGFPLQAKCPGDETVVNSGDEDGSGGEDENDSTNPGLYVSIGIGFIVGFLGAFLGTLHRKRLPWHKAK